MNSEIRRVDRSIQIDVDSLERRFGRSPSCKRLRNINRFGNSSICGDYPINSNSLRRCRAKINPSKFFLCSLKQVQEIFVLARVAFDKNTILPQTRGDGFTALDIQISNNDFPASVFRNEFFGASGSDAGGTSCYNSLWSK